MEDIYDLIIIGGASAGLTAAIYASRRAMKTLVLTKDIGGQLSTTPDVENYPGYNSISGWDLSDKFKKQAESFGAEIKFAEVSSVTPVDDGFTIVANGTEYRTHTVILAFGKTPRNLEVPGEKEFQGKGVSYCSTCDMPFFKNKVVAVVGGGNSAIDGAIYGSKVASKIYLIHRRDQYRGEQILIDRMLSIENIEPVYNSIVKEVKGDGVVKSIMVNDIVTNETKEIAVDGVFVEIGYVVKAEFVSHLVEMNEKKEIITDKHMMTKTPGLFAAGDLTTSAFKQAVISAGEGCIAALAAYEFVMRKQGRAMTTVDWGTAPKVDEPKTAE